MLRSAQRLVLPQASLLQQACLYSSKTEVDYNELVIKATSDIAKVEPVPDKEIGMCAGVPLETFKRTVGFWSSNGSSNGSSTFVLYNTAGQSIAGVAGTARAATPPACAAGCSQQD
jgi:hypothetical protein